MRAIEEFQKLFNRKPGSILINYAEHNGLHAEDASSRYEKASAELYRQAILHWGQGHVNSATTACVMHMAEIAALETWKGERRTTD
jgi:hypothetical protein